MNWGWKIVFAFSVFFVFIMYLVIRAFQENIGLVTDDYYAQELVYQERIDKQNNLKLLSEIVSADLTSEGIVITYPETVGLEAISGSIWLYRPSSQAFDKTYAIKVGDEGNQVIPPSEFTSGKYVLKIDWSDGIREYYQEISILIPG